MLNELLSNPFWTWVVIGLSLLAIELLLINSYYLLWISGAALLTAITALVASLTVSVQVMIFAVFCVVLLVVSRRFNRKAVTDNGIVTRDVATIGRVGKISGDKIDGYPTISLLGAIWKVNGEFEPNTSVEVVAVNNGILDVKAQ